MTDHIHILSVLLSVLLRFCLESTLCLFCSFRVGRGPVLNSNLGYPWLGVSRRCSKFAVRGGKTFTNPASLKLDADGKLSVKFGVLFQDDRCANLFEALVGTLKAAKRRKIVTYAGELLLQGVHDDVDIVLLQD